MPFTAFHLPLVLPAKAIAPRLISIRAFIVTQVAIDGFVLLRMFAGIEPLHGLEHVGLGALIVALLAVLCSQIGCIRTRLGYKERLPWSAVICTALYGAISHVWADMASHYDVAEANGMGPMLRAHYVDYDATVSACIGIGIIGAVMLAIRGVFWRNDKKPAPE